MIRKSIEQRFWEKVNKDGPYCERLGSKCWEWVGSTSEGYGRFSLNNRDDKAHRVSWKIHFGEITTGLLVCHKCDNPSCVNPDHLFLGTQSDNMRDCANKCRLGSMSRHREGHHFAKLNRSSVDSIILEYNKGGISERELGNKYNISKETISKIITHKLWKCAEDYSI